MGRVGGSGGFGVFARNAVLIASGLALANCASGNYAGKVDPKWGVASSTRVVEPGEPVPKGGGVYRVGKPYTVAGRTYTPEENIDYVADGLASWYGDDFHGRYTANGEVYDMNSISAAHPTLPLPSYVRVTNLANRRSIVVRVNDRGPYVGNRIIDLSSKTAQLLGFHGKGVARVRVEYIGRAPLTGSDDAKLAATLRDGRSPVRVADAKPLVPEAKKPFGSEMFDARPIERMPAERPSRIGEGARDVPAEPRSVEMAAATRPQPAKSPASTGASPGEHLTSAVSAYAPAGYDARAGFMGGRGLY
jgi:rare lipoprotein A